MVTLDLALMFGVVNVSGCLLTWGVVEPLRQGGKVLATVCRASPVANGYLAECRRHAGLCPYLGVNPLALGTLGALRTR